VTSESVLLSEDQHLELDRISQSRSLPAGYVFRAKLILMLAEGASYNTIKQRLGTTAPTISRWKQRFLITGLDGLDTAHPGQKPSVLTARLRARVLAATRKARPRMARPTGVAASWLRLWASARTPCIVCGRRQA
jgi:hypothetical protein